MPNRWHSVPSNWELSDDLRQWTRDMGLTDEMIDDQLERFRDHDYAKPKSRPDACWRNWIKLGIDNQWIVLPQKTRYRRPEEVSEADRKQAQMDFERQMEEWGVSVIGKD